MINLEKQFFKFIYERQLIWYKRFILKQKFPWTNDKILRDYKIINIYRELDKCTIYIIDKLKDIKDRKKILINIIFYRFFNQFNLYDKLKTDLINNIDEKTKKNLIEKFNRIKNKGEPIFNNAYLISSGEKGKKKHISILNNLQNLNLDKIIKKIDTSKTPEESFEPLKQIPMIGPFLACEIWTDLAYLKFFKQKWTDNDFVNIGPGAKWGLEIIYNQKLNSKEQKEKLNHLSNIQKKFLNKKYSNWKNIAYKHAFSNYPFLSLTNLEGSSCEFRKYWNIKHGKGKRRYFHPMNHPEDYGK